MAVFPLEIFQLIIESFPRPWSDITELEFIENEFHITLMNCCLVCKDFVPLCRRELFHHVNIGIHRGMSVSHKRLFAVLEKNPNISAYVKSVNYVLNSASEEALITRDGKAPEAVPSSLLEYHNTDTSFFPNVTNLQICHELVDSHRHTTAFHYHHYGLYCDKDECYEASTPILRHFSRYPPLTYLTLRGISVLMQDIFSLVSVQSLIMIECGCSDDPPFQNLPPARHLSLKDLCISTVCGFPFQALQYCPYLQSIDSLELKLGFVDHHPLLGNTADWKKVVVYSHLHTILFDDPYGISQLCNAAEAAGQLAFPAVEKLETSFEEILLSLCYDGVVWANMDSPEPQLDRCLTSSLTDFTFEYYERNHDISFILSLCRALSRIKGDNNLEYLYIMTSVRVRQMHEWKEASLPHWKVIDKILTGAGCSDFPKLQQVVMSIDYYGLEDFRDEANAIVRDSVQDFWSEALPLLHEFYVPSFVIVSASTCDIDLRRKEYIISSEL